jgi:hypothetical protein
MRLRPDQTWLTACLQYTTEHFGAFTIQVKTLICDARESNILVSCITIAFCLPQGLASIVYALAMLGYHPGKRWLIDFHRGVESSFKDIPPESMAMLQKAYAILKFSAATPHGPGSSLAATLETGDPTCASGREAAAPAAATESAFGGRIGRRGGRPMSERPSRFASR